MEPVSQIEFIGDDGGGRGDGEIDMLTELLSQVDGLRTEARRPEDDNWPVDPQSPVAHSQAPKGEHTSGEGQSLSTMQACVKHISASRRPKWTLRDLMPCAGFIETATMLGQPGTRARSNDTCS